MDEDPREESRPSLFQDFPNLRSFPLGRVYGCGFVNPEQLSRYFSLAEITKLYDLNFRIVEMSVLQILAKSEFQCVWSRKEKLTKGIHEMSLNWFKELACVQSQPFNQ